MREICIPVPGFGEDQIAEVFLTVGGEKISYSYRVESFPWNIEGFPQPADDQDYEHATLEQIALLRNALAKYDKSWELIQIFTPRKGASHIQVLYRKKNGK
jgi:hypothetical protein